MSWRQRREVVRSGVPEGRTGEDLNHGLMPVEDARHRLRGPMHYEWWYFDATFDNGYSAVAIIWPMNYSRPWRRQCTVQLSIYTPEGRTYKHYIFPRRRLFSASYERCDVRVGDFVHIEGPHPTYRVQVEAEGDMVDLVFEAETHGWKPGAAVNYLPFPRYSSFCWHVPVPRALVSGAITVQGEHIGVEGHGYHDHNWGEVPFIYLIDNWNWGHIVHGELGIIWADITLYRGLDYERIYMFLLSSGERLVYESADLRIKYSEWKKDPGYLHPYPGLITVSFGSEGEPAAGEIRMKVSEVLETQDLLEMVGLPGAVNRVVNLMAAKPYYFRWRSQVEGWVKVDGDRMTLGGDTIHEQMLLRGRRPGELFKQSAGHKYSIMSRR